MRMLKQCTKFLIVLAVIISCENEQSNIENELLSSEKVEVLLNKSQTQTLLRNGVNPFTGDAKAIDIDFMGERLRGISVDDYFFSYDELTPKTIKDDSKLIAKSRGLFASTNRIDLPENGKRTVRIGALVEGNQSLNELTVAALAIAHAKYNALQLNKLVFKLVEITTEQALARVDSEGKPIDIVVLIDIDGDFVGNSDGRTFFPSNGDPGRFVALNTVTRNFSLKNNTILLMHELGHALGMAHSDFRTRVSCGNTAPLDFILGDLAGVPNVTEICNISGTDNSGNFTESIMRACGFFVFEEAEFQEEDVEAFSRLYENVDIDCVGGLSGGDAGCRTFSATETEEFIDDNGQELFDVLVQFGIICQ